MEYAGPTRPGRPRSSSRPDLSGTALRLFRTRGFAETSVEDIARAAGISRSTFFNYFSSKADAIWSCTARQLELLESRLAESDEGDPFEVAARAVIDITAPVGPDQAEVTADYGAVVEASPELRLQAQTWSAQRTEILSSYMSRMLGPASGDLLPLAYASALNGAVGAAGIAFGRSRGRRLSEFMVESVMPVCNGYAAVGS